MSAGAEGQALEAPQACCVYLSLSSPASFLVTPDLHPRQAPDLLGQCRRPRVFQRSTAPVFQVRQLVDGYISSVSTAGTPAARRYIQQASTARKLPVRVLLPVC